METSSFAARRPAATSLPAFTLPPPDLPRALGDSISPSSGMHSGSSQSSQTGMYAYQMAAGQWPQSASSHSYSYSAHSSSANSASGSIVPPSSSYHARPLYGQASPHVPSFPSRQSPSPAAGESLSTQSSYPDQQQFPGPLAQPILSSQATSTAAQPPTPASSAGPSPPENGYRTAQTPTQYYAPSSTPQQSSYPSFAPQPSPPMPSPTTAGGLSRGLTSMTLAPPHLGYPAPSRPPSAYGSYGQGYLGGVTQHGAPIMMGMSPGMNGMPAYPPHHLHHMYPSHGGQTVPPQDRPFKCDSCQQSFNRNHDLKRHKRIHLAVKPFPCTFCEKTFSRKDALKRHRLVKGCGKGEEGVSSASKTEQSPPTVPDDSSAEMMDEQSPQRYKEEV